MVMDDATRKQEARRRAAQERLGRNDAQCPYCGEADARCLELHHIAGRKFDDETIPVCRNCHRKLSDMQRDHPRPLHDDPGWMERLGHLLLGLADLLALAVAKLKELAVFLIEKARATPAEGARS
jgi:hypothetical protein